MTEKRFTKQEVYDDINRYRINESNFIVEILDDGIPMHYSTIVNRLNEQHKTITRLEKENEQLKSIKKFADRNGICIFNIDEAFRRCWQDNAKLVKENEQLKSENQSWLKSASHFDNVAHKDRGYAKRMHKENEQLKKENKKLNCIIKQLEVKYEDKGFSLAYDMGECE